MSILVHQIHWEKRQGYYEVEYSGPNLVIPKPDMNDPACDLAIQTYAAQMLDAINAYGTLTPIELTTFLARLKLEFQDGDTAMPFSTYPPGSYSWTRWTPGRLRIYLTRYTWEWNLQDVGDGPAPSGTDELEDGTRKDVVLENDGGEIDLTYFTNEIVSSYPEEGDGAAGVGADAGTGASAAAGLPPFILQPGIRAEQRRRIRLARIRAAKARLQYERLRRRYYEQYGFMDGSDRHSVLTATDSDDEDTSPAAGGGAGNSSGSEPSSGEED